MLTILELPLISLEFQKVLISKKFLTGWPKGEHVLFLDFLQNLDAKSLQVAGDQWAIHQELKMLVELERHKEVRKVHKLLDLGTQCPLYFLALNILPCDDFVSLHYGKAKGRGS